MNEPVARAIGHFLLGTAHVPHALLALGILVALLLVPFGIWMLKGGRDFSPTPQDDLHEPRPPARTPLHAFRSSLSHPTRTAFGLCALILAWHAIAWTHPQFDLLRVPVERWWILALGVLITLWGSMAMDRWLS